MVAIGEKHNWKNKKTFSAKRAVGVAVILTLNVLGLWQQLEKKKGVSLRRLALYRPKSQNQGMGA